MRTDEHLPGQTSAARSFVRKSNSVPTARSWATGICESFGVTDDLLETCKLLISEVVTNAVTHGDGDEYTVVVARDLWFEVWDEGEELPRRREHDLDSEGGRGLDLLDLLAPGYEVLTDHVRGGKGVRFQPKGFA
ncbi:ATP-binding protein [Streptomyces sp. NPDC088360]|uniref:ATP-binding protein n=1 Tax=Streptomyces sp. NPDC088360 TaxID=3154515 RepID=UPI00344F0278